MTKLKPLPLIRETAATERGQPIVVELHPRYMALRIKGKIGGRLNVPYEAVLDLARKLAYRMRKSSTNCEPG